MVAGCKDLENRSELSPWMLVSVAILFLLIMVSNACSEESPKISLRWDCWIQVDGNPISIACIHDRDGLDPKLAEDQEALLEDILLNKIHDRIHTEQTDGLNQLISENSKVFRVGSLWIIPIYNLPFESSWETGRIHLLINTWLCPNGMLCIVNIEPPH